MSLASLFRRGRSGSRPGRRRRLQLEELGDRRVPAQTATLVADMYLGRTGSSPTHLTDASGTLYFAAREPAAGVELWKSDGTPDGTARVKDISKGPRGSQPEDLTAVGNVVYFTAADGGPFGPRRLWRSDGTEDGTQPVDGAADHFDFDELTSYDGELYFKANAGAGINRTGLELWRVGADGVVHPVAEMPGLTAVGPSELTVVPTGNGTSLLYFAGYSSATGREIWRTDGTAAGTVVAADVNPGTTFVGRGLGSDPANLTASGTALYFVAGDGTNGRELWHTGGGDPGTQLVGDIRAGRHSSSPRHLTDVGGVLFFTANDGATGEELWRVSAGELLTAVPVANIRPGFQGSVPASLADVDGTLFFAANDGTNGVELWKSDGTAAGTQLVRDIRPGRNGSTPGRLVDVNGTLYFTASDGTTGIDVWLSDGTRTGTRLLSDVTRRSADPTPDWLTNVNGELYFAAYDRPNGTELWRSYEPHAVVPPADRADAERAPVSLSVEVTNPEGEALRFSAVNLPAGLIIHPTTGVISGTIGGQAARTQPYEVRVLAEGDFEQAEATFLWTVSDLTPPTVTNPGPQGNNEGNNMIQPSIFAADPDGDPLTVRAEGMPPGMHFVSRPDVYSYFTGTLGPRAAMTGTYGSPADGVYLVTVYAGDGFNETAETFLWTVGDVTVPVFQEVGPQFNNEGNAIGLRMIAQDPEGDPLTYGVTGLPPWLYVVPKTNNTAEINGVLGPQSAGTYEVTVTATDGHSTGRMTFTWTVRDLTTPTVENPGPQSGPPGSEVSLQIVAGDSGNDPMVYSATGLPPGLSIHPGTGLISGTIGPAVGSFNVTVSAGDGSSAGQAAFVWDVVSAGRLDPAFAGDGAATTDFTGWSDRAYATVVQLDGKVVVVGMTETGVGEPQRDFGLARFNADGSPDATFGPGGPDGDGKVTTDLSFADEARAVALQGDLVLVAGSTYGTSSDFALLRYKSLGSLDTDFGANENGTVRVDLGGTDAAVAMAIQPDGKVVVGGYTDAAGQFDFALVRFTADGLIDPTFGTNGRVITDVAGGADSLSGLAVQPDGSIVAVGTARVGTADQFAAVRYLPDGTPDDTFGAVSGSVRTGKAVVPIGPSAGASGVALRGDGRILLAGTSYETATGFNFTLALLDPSGDLDGSFGTGGIVRTDLAGNNEQARAVRFQSDGRFVVAGRAGSGTATDFALVRYDAGGLLDPTFDLDGILTTDVNGADELYGIALDGDRLVAVGSSAAAGSQADLTVARYFL